MSEFSGSLRVHNPVATKAPLYVRAAPRPGTLAGKRIGLIWNGKPGGDVALEVAAEHIAKRFPDATFWRSDWYSYPFTDPQLQQIVDHCDVAIGTTGD
ncbi:MAG: hypothetical protein EOO21_06540 [Comamonadaceae bacterium]|nr:MAG: hypothetical protein EOO21_06540 [Comamonadaceae bacterium]